MLWEQKQACCLPAHHLKAFSEIQRSYEHIA